MINRTDLYTQITAAILADLERGVRPWIRPWRSGPVARPLRSNGQPYRGINVLTLWIAAAAQHFTAPVWMTFRQAKELNGSVKKGSRGTLVVYTNRMTKIETAEDGRETERAVPFLKSFAVFNVEQIQGLPAHWYTQAAPSLEPAQRIDAADRFFAATGADIRHGGNRAYYAAESDRVQMPPFASFRDAESYCSTLAHELTHNAARRIMPHSGVQRG
jgi:antirestriction protein ArdC